MSIDTQLSTFFERQFLPLRIGGEGAYASQCRGAIRWLTEYLERPALVSDLNHQTLDSLDDFLQQRGHGKHRRATIRKRLGSLLLTACRLGLLAPPKRPRSAPAQLPGPTLATPVIYSQGSVWEYFETVYRPLRLTGRTKQNLDKYRSTFRFLRKWSGRDVLLTELTDQLAAEFFEWMLTCRTAASVNGHRAQLFSVWRLAHERGKVPVEPRVRKFAECLDEPDAWSPDEARAIVAATAALADWPPIAGIPADKYFRAMMLVAWWAALRRGSLLKLRMRDVDFEGAWLNVPGRSMKNRSGRRFRLGQDALDAIRDIVEPQRELLFPWPWRIGRIYRYFDEMLRVAGVKPSTRSRMTKLHKWRRTVATVAAVERGMHAATSLLNQSGQEVTRRYVDASKLPGNDATEFLPSLTEPQSKGTQS